MYIRLYVYVHNFSVNWVSQCNVKRGGSLGSLYLFLHSESKYSKSACPFRKKQVKTLFVCFVKVNIISILSNTFVAIALLLVGQNLTDNLQRLHNK